MPGRQRAPPCLPPRHLAPPCLRHHHQRPRPFPRLDQEARRPLPPGARLAPRGDIRAGVGEGGRTHGYCGGLQDVWEGRFLLSLGGCRPGGGGEGPDGGGGVFVPLEPLEDLGVRLVLTSVPPFLPNAALLPALSTLGKLVSVISPLPLGCKDPTLRQIFSFRRQVQLLPPAGARDGEVLEGSFLVPYQGARYRVFYSTGEAWCYLCLSAGHVRRDCPLARGEGHPKPPRPGRTSAPSLPTPLAAQHLKPTLLLLDPSLLPSGPKRYLPYNARASKGFPPLLVPTQQSLWRRVWQGYYRV
ncbi:unnamed protein product [Lepidochelys kempii]